MPETVLIHDHLNQQGGAERVVYTLHELFPDSPVYTLLYDPKAMHGMFDGVDVRDSFLRRIPGARRWFKWFLVLMPRAIESHDIAHAQLVVSSASSFAKGVIKNPGAVHVCYCHTPTRYLWSHAKAYTDELAVPKVIKKMLPLVLNYLREWDMAAAADVDYFIANSKSVAQRIKTYYNRNSIVIYPPVDTSVFSSVPINAVGEYYLLVSRFRPYKRVDLAIQAFNKLGIPLKIIGTGEEARRLKKMARSNIEFLGFVSEEEKVHLMAHARALIHPQADEDFGITAVESMAAGRPVIAFRGGGVLETVIEGTTGVFFEEQAWQSLAEAVIRFDHTQFDPEQIKARAREFDTSLFKKSIQSFLAQLEFSKAV